MMRVCIHSRRGNLILGFLGFIYAVSGTVLLTWLVIDVWLAASFRDRILQLGLLGAAVCGVWFLLSALHNLGIHFRKHAHR